MPVRRDDLDNISISLAEKLELDYVCFDFLATGDAFYLIDINPHGSWAWLPEEARGLVDSQMEAWLTSLLV
jgi:glutathione synthase/RimK-type ligase-like ATP-grasp enzyme